MFYLCKDYKKRSYQKKPYYWCTKKKEKVSEDCYLNCKELEKRQYKKINKVSKNHKSVSIKTYDDVFKRDKGRCRICKTILNLELHHIRYRSEDINLIDDVDNCIMLCTEHHRKVHSNKHLYQPQLLEQVKSGKQIILKESKDE